VASPADAGRAQSRGRPLKQELLNLLRCPATGQTLHEDAGRLVSADGSRTYRLSPSGVPLFGEDWLSPEGAVQRDHYERIAGVYLTNLTQAHTREYMAYMDRAVLRLMESEPMGCVAEICCGAGEAFHLLNASATLGVGVDVSPAMLEAARKNVPDETALFVNGDATKLPLRDGRFDMVVMLGGVHHVNDRQALFSEIRRILKPGGSFIFREPLDDFFLWRALRSAIYSTSSTLEADTERPLRYRDTREQLARAGLSLEVWRAIGFFGYCFLMNGDVLAINRVWQYVPGAIALTRFATKVDEWTLRLPGLSGAGLAVVGRARRA
jgi:ubiquinone/menaquinone biosynthesis C-methylase UbiE